MGLIDMHISLLQEFLSESAGHMGKPVPVDAKKPV
jgi:hypothetical protein